MSNQIFPTLPGWAAERDCTPEFDNAVTRASSGRRYALGKRLYPVWRWVLKANFLRQRLDHEELNALQGFFLQRRGNLDSFLYRDREWNTVADPQVFGIGNGADTRFRLAYDRGGFIDLVRWAQAERITMDVGDWRGARQLFDAARTNGLKRSGDFNFDADWTKREIVLSGPVVGPDGFASAWQLREAASTALHDMVQTFSVVAGQIYTGSFWLKSGSHNVAQLAFGSSGFGANAFANVNIATGAIGSKGSACTVQVDEATPSGWRRASISAVAVASVPSAGFSVGFVNDNMMAGRAPSYLGNVGSNIQAAFAQVEIGAFATPYIPTAATAVTQAADYSLDDHGYVTLAAAAPEAAELAWTGEYLFRVAFARPSMTFRQFLKDLYSVDGVELETTNL